MKTLEDIKAAHAAALAEIEAAATADGGPDTNKLAYLAKLHASNTAESEFSKLDIAAKLKDLEAKAVAASKAGKRILPEEVQKDVDRRVAMGLHHEAAVEASLSQDRHNRRLKKAAEDEEARKATEAAAAEEAKKTKPVTTGK